MIDTAQWRGDRRIRVTLALDERSARPEAMWLLDGPAVQRVSLAGPYVAHVDVAGLSLLQSLGDPFLTRAIQRPEQVGHSLTRLPRTTVHVDVPLDVESSVETIAIRIADLTDVESRPAEWDALAQLLARQPEGARWLPTVDFATLANHPDWREVERELHKLPRPEYS
jgi:hypothetical protein